MIKTAVLLIFLFLVNKTSYANWHDEGCNAQSIKEFSFEYKNSEYSIDKFINIKRNNKLLYQSHDTYNLATEQNNVYINKTDNYLLVQISETDCIDRFASYIFIISNEGKLMLQQQIWTSNYLDGFFILNGKLAYWSKWFCSKYNNSLSSTQNSYIYVTNKSHTSFQKVIVNRSEYCDDNNIQNLKSKFIQFTNVTPSTTTANK